MSDQNDSFETNEEEDICINCTTRGCDTPAGCDYQTDFDKSMGIYSYRDTPMDFAMTNAERVRKGLPPIVGNGPLTSDPPTQPLPPLIPADPALLLGPAGIPEPNRVETSPVDPPVIKRRPGRPPSGTPKVRIPKKPSGGQAGNLNALKHGLYVQGNALHNTSPLERSQLFDLKTAVNQYKNFINFTYENGLKLTEMDQINETLRTLSIAAIALTRLLNVHDQADPNYLPFDKNARTPRSMQKLVDFYNNKISSFMDTSDPSSDLI